jgi:hypothetical protein
MTTLDTSLAKIAEEGRKLVGPYRAPANLAQNAAGSIHKDEVAQKLGFRGGTVAGSIHMEQFPPALVAAFGERWFETGGLSTYFRNATMHGERVRPIVERPASDAADQQINVWMERDDGMLVLEGTASVGSPDEPSMIRDRVANARSGGDVRILEHLEVGRSVEGVPTRLNLADVTARLEVLTEPLDWYSGDSPWGGPIVNPGMAVRLFRPVERSFDIRRNQAVGLFGGIEVRHLAGPIFADHDYEARGTVLAVGETPKSEFFWYESTISDSGTDVAEMVMMLRFMKASSDLWSD